MKLYYTLLHQLLQSTTFIDQKTMNRTAKSRRLNSPLIRFIRPLFGDSGGQGEGKYEKSG